jgi:hydroxymethylglutaryl-CoA lyase
LDASNVGLVCTEDMALMMHEMGIETGIDVDKILRLGAWMEKTAGRQLRSEAIRSGKILKEPNEQYKRKGLQERKDSLGEAVGQKFPK